MQKHYIEPIKNHEKFTLLLKQRQKLAFILSLMVLIVYFSFILVIAFYPSFLAQTISKDSVITIGIPIGIFIIVFSFVVSGIYVYIANKYFDAYTRSIHQDVVGAS